MKDINLALHNFIILLITHNAIGNGIGTRNEVIGNDYDEHKLECFISCRTEDNFLYSSASVYAAMGLAFLAATNETGNDILYGMYNQPEDTVPLMKDFYEEYESLKDYIYHKDPKAIQMDTTIFHNEGLEIDESFFHEAKRHLLAKKKSVNFRETKNAISQINSVIENEINNQIKNVVTDAAIDNETNIVFENNLHFNGEWKHPFNGSYTAYRDFYVDGKTKKKILTMGQINKFHYYFSRTLRSTVIQLPFKDGSTMLIIMPKSKSISELKDLQNNLQTKSFSSIKYATQMNDLDEDRKPRRIYLQLPAFKLERRIPFNDVLEEVASVGNSSGDFTPMLKNRQENFLKSVNHVAVMDITEKGVAAVGATDLTFNRRTDFDLRKRYTADQPHPNKLNKRATKRAEQPNLDVYARKVKKIIVDRPFMFAIINDDYKDSTLFIGTMRNDNFSPTSFTTGAVDTNDYCQP